jgi:hypothetical protein
MSSIVVALGDHGDVVDAGHGAAHVLDLACRHVLAADLERVLVAVAVEDVAVGSSSARCRRYGTSRRR